MNRYIEVDHLKKSVEELPDCYNGFSDTYDKSCIIGLIDEEPTSDVVPVVRCKDCKWCNKEYYGEHETEWVWYCPNVEKMVGDEWFCADGEKVAES